MRLPFQQEAIRREQISLSEKDWSKKRSLKPSCDPTTQITCGTGCCNAASYYCVNGQCRPYS